MAKTQIKNYVFKPGLGQLDNLYPNAYSLLESNKTFIQKETVEWIQSQIDAGETDFVGYTYDSIKCERDIGYNIDAYLKDLRYGGNENTFNVVKYYWDQDVSQINGDRSVEVSTYEFIKTLIQNYILTNTLYNALNTTITQTVDLTKTTENQANVVLGNLIDATKNVIDLGISEFPTFESTGLGYIKIQGRYDLEDILLITNTTKNEIIYNFSNINTGGQVNFKSNKNEIDNDFSKYLQTTDTITKIYLNYNTSLHNETDVLQIFVEKVENGKSVVVTRPYDFGTDAIERMRVAQPLSMLDADFEYGLQPTKWAAIGTLRGYPSVYEVPGTDTPVLKVITDASAGTEGIGQSLITVTTVSPHGLSEGTPVTIKALEDSVVGAARAEGSFVITSVPTSNTFTYFAKSKVGTTNGDVLSTTYTQLRQAGFYTGSNIGNPTVDVISNGFSGSIVTELAISSGSTIIPFDGITPEIGAPLADASGSIPTGTQITGIIDNSAGGGTYLTPSVIGSYPSGVDTITFDDTTGIIPNLAVDRGDGTAIYVDSINDNEVTFTEAFNTPIVGNIEVYTDVSGSNDLSVGNNATFDVSRSDTTYTVTINNNGNNYKIGDSIIISGNTVGGSTPENDIIVTVNAVSNGQITNISHTGTAFNGVASIENLVPELNGNQGTGATFDVTFENNTFLTVDVTSPDNSSGYSVNDRLILRGDSFNSNGTSPENDLIITVTGIGENGAITSVSFTGTAPDALVNYENPAYATSGSGTDIDFSVTRSGETYTIIFSNQGTGFLPTDTITITGDQLGGTTPLNDLTITVDNVGGLGEITAYSESGIAVNSQESPSVSANNLIGSGFTVTVDLSAGSYSLTVVTGGSDYAVNQSFTILGNNLIGLTPDNDLTITINSVDSSGAITSVTPTGTANDGTSSFTEIQGTNNQSIGENATFDITRENGVYSILIKDSGNNYISGNRIIIPGDILGGSQPENNAEIYITNVSSGSITNATVSGIANPGNDFDLISTLLISEPTDDLIEKNTELNYEALATLEITFDSAHGLVPGNTFIVTVSSDDGVNNHNLSAGSFFTTDIPTVNTLRYQARAAGTIDTDNDAIQAIVYPRPDSFFIHRPFDGGVQLGTGGPQHGAQAIRQSKKYIRYQSGKGIMYTTGALFAPSYDLRSVTADGVEVGSTITIVTDDNDHGVQVGGIVRLLGIETPGYNSGAETVVPPQFDYEVIEVIDERTFKVKSQRRLGSTTAVLGFGAQMSVVSWHGATVRSGIFDDQNGVFWEYDGTQINVVQRTGTRQLAGTIAMAVDNNLITGTNTRFVDQLKAGDRIIIKGMTHVVSHVNSQTECTVTPDWRGVVDISGAKANLIVDKKVKQNEFNLDRLDGTGPSGYNIDIAKMQMIGIQYSWYGAGFIDFMLRGADGNFVYAHRMRNSNVNTEAFMRSGNLPVRYEVSNEGPSGKLAQSITDSQTTMILEDSSFFPDSGVVYIDNEIISFSGNNKSTNTLTGCIRNATFNNFQAGATRSYTAGIAASHSARTGVILISQTITPLISHWGSAFITDGMFDEDRGYIFSYAETGIDVSTTKQTAFLIRLAPSVSNALVGDLGERELLNRAQLLLQGLEITSDGNDGTNDILGGIVVEGILNPQNYPINPNDIGWSGLSSVAQGGQPSFAQVASGGSVVWSTGEAATTANLTAQAAMTTNRESNDFSRSSNSYLWVRWNGTNGIQDSNIQIGDTVTIPGGNTRRITFISSPSSFGGFTEVFMRLDGNLGANVNSGTSLTFNRHGNLTNRNFGLFTKTSVDTAGVSVGTSVTGGSDVTFPSNTQINNITLNNFGETEYYEIQFNSTYSGTLIAGTGTVEVTFVQPPYAQPGETVFSFIAQPGDRATVDFSELKELTNTPLGGRGTYPNGPDVLAINVYKVSGADVPANIILRWGEAQA